MFDVVRGRGRASVTEVADQLTAQKRPLAYTTVMTVLTRLWQKGYLARKQEGRAFLYEARPEDDIAGDQGGRAAHARPLDRQLVWLSRFTSIPHKLNVLVLVQS